MPRNRKRRPALEPVTALVRWLDRETCNPGHDGKVRPQAQVSCARCKATMTSVTDHAGQLLDSPRFRLDRYGYRWDGDAWRPTSYHRRQRQRVREAVAALPAPEAAHHRERLRTNTYFHRSIWRRAPPHGDRRDGSRIPVDVHDAESLPTKWECWSCAQINVIAVD